ncbi:malto-oligosyltrehalose trehalohydrolase [Aminobacter sp. J44]|uniref:malto-oligosyltrehalose trehalohydrolase n=1 Tax=Aminobacter sp. J44 TaxID=935262 RepID=UPI00119AF101|nr:malto-oligosyltrehalose trehalohydrolase [Aminobacter sp. J44]TWG53805.1 malto-oligosyltrehalose trehalohydrolase [Aminobacter sp. J44]
MPEPDREYRVYPRHWGAEYVRAGEVRFRIWAPAFEELSIRIDGEETEMGRDKDGWFELLASGVAPGTPYSFILPDGRSLPDPASRAQQADVHGPSLVVDATQYRWKHSGWRGRDWREAVVYELHVGTFTEEGTFLAAIEKLPHLVEAGFTAIELMPVAQFPGKRGWGYDGVLPYAPHHAYGTPDDLKQLVDEAHGHGLMIMLDVVYNHFGPDGNYLPTFAPEFFDEKRHTPWGAAIAYDRLPVRQFFLDNARYWLDEYNFDGLRLDAIDQIRDPSPRELLVELAEKVRREFTYRPRHLVTEDNRNVASLHVREDGKATLYTGEWNDDFHNAAHVLLTGEDEGYYEDYAKDPAALLARSLAEGYCYQGEASKHLGGKPRGEPSTGLPTTAFIDFLQNHDQIGNRALGERLSELASPEAIRALTAILLLSPHIPMMFMGEEWGERRPFLFFADYHGSLADAVREGRRKEFAHFKGFGRDPKLIPDPNDLKTFKASRIDWSQLETDEGRARLEEVRALLALRREHIVPYLDDNEPSPGVILPADPGLIAINWQLGNARLALRANLTGEAAACPLPDGEIIFRAFDIQESDSDVLQPWDVLVAVET